MNLLSWPLADSQAAVVLASLTSLLVSSGLSVAADLSTHKARLQCDVDAHQSADPVPCTRYGVLCVACSFGDEGLEGIALGRQVLCACVELLCVYYSFVNLIKCSPGQASVDLLHCLLCASLTSMLMETFIACMFNGVG